MSRLVRKVLVVLSDISERDASKDLEREMRPLLGFPCIFQVVSDTFIALNFTQKQFYDIIIVPQKVEDPINISTFVECLLTSDGCSPPFICLLEEGEEERRFEKVRTLFVRYINGDEIPIMELGAAITTALSEEIQTATEVDEMTPRVRDARSSARTVMAEAAVVSTERAARPTKRAKRQAVPVSRTSEPASRPPAQVRPHFSLEPASYPQPLHSAHIPPGAESHWQAMQRQAQLAFNHHYAPPAWGPPPGYHQPISIYHHQPLPLHSQQPQSAPLTQPSNCQTSAVPAPRPVRPQEFFHAPQAAVQEQRPYVSVCPMSPTPKARPKKNHRGPVTTTTITYGPPTHTGIGTTTQVPRSAEDAAVLPLFQVCVHKNHQPFGDALRTPERSPPMPVQVPLTGRGRTAEVMLMETSEDDDVDDLLRESSLDYSELLPSIFDDGL